MATPRAIGVRRLNALLQRAGEALFVLDAGRRLVYVNRAWSSLTGRSFEEVQGLEFSEGTAGDVDPLPALARSLAPPPELAPGRPVGGTALLPRVQGGLEPVHVEFFPLADDRRLVAILGLIRHKDDDPIVPESETLRLRTALDSARLLARDRLGREDVIGDGPAHHRLLDQIDLAASGTMPVLIQGEAGTGKRRVALAIHRRRGPESEPLVSLDPATTGHETIRSEISRTSEVDPRPGCWLARDPEAWPTDLQDALASEARSRRTAVLATTEVDPDRALGDGRLRPGLYYALTGLVIRLRPLRERLEELPLLAMHALSLVNSEVPSRRRALARSALDALRRHDWPGNLEELLRVIRVAHEGSDGPEITDSNLPATILGDRAGAYELPTKFAAAVPLDDSLASVERRLIELALRAAGQNKSKAAELLAISRPRLYRRIEELGIGSSHPAPKQGDR